LFTNTASAGGLNTETTFPLPPSPSIGRIADLHILALACCGQFSTSPARSLGVGSATIHSACRRSSAWILLIDKVQATLALWCLLLLSSWTQNSL